MSQMDMIPKMIFVLLLISSLLLNGCGGGSIFAEGGMGGTGISTGTVTGIGSITVNGVTFDTNDAAIYIERERIDNPETADATGAFLLAQGFSEGQVVRVVGRFNDDGKTGTADAVYFNDSVEGPVDPDVGIISVDPNTIEFVVMGQNVIVDSETTLAPNGTLITDIIDNIRVEVSGLRDEQGRIYASYLFKGTLFDPINDPVELKGVIEAGSLTSDRFTINGLIVLYDANTELPSISLLEGMQVEIKGTYDETTKQLSATKIELEDDIDGSDDNYVEYEGIVNSTPDSSDPLDPFVAGDSFVMGIQVVQTVQNTEFRGGSALDIKTGVHLEVEGYLDGGTLFADEVRFRDSIEIDAPVITHTPTDPASSSVILTLNLGTETATVRISSLSKVSGEANSLSDLITKLNTGASNADHVEVRGRLLQSAEIFAEEIKLDDNNFKTDIKIQAPASNVQDPDVTILGVIVNTDDIPNSGIIGFNDQVISREQFFATLKINNIVSAEGELSSGVVLWDKIELEDEE